jgi:hypothetical protein
MPTEAEALACLYRALAEEARYVPLDPPSAVRARADRRARARATLAVSTAAALVAGVATTGAGMLGEDLTSLTPAPQITVEVSPAVTSSSRSSSFPAPTSSG